MTIAIPSYDRPNELERKSIRFLKENGITDNIDVFVNDESQKKLYSHIKGIKLIIVGKKGIMNARNFMSSYYPKGKKIVYLDDDITAIYKGNKIKTEMKKVYNLKELITKGFALCDKHKFFKWGLNPSQNRRSLYDTITTDLRYIGFLTGEINQPSIRATVDYSEDFERTILYYKKGGGVIRFNHYVAKSILYAKGGNQATGRNKDNERKDKLIIQKKYPNYARIIVRGSGRTDIRLIKNPVM